MITKLAYMENIMTAVAGRTEKQTLHIFLVFRRFRMKSITVLSLFVVVAGGSVVADPGSKAILQL